MKLTLSFGLFFPEKKVGPFLGPIWKSTATLVDPGVGGTQFRREGFEERRIGSLFESLCLRFGFSSAASAR
jgi:hypothetical protein